MGAWTRGASPDAAPSGGFLGGLFSSVIGALTGGGAAADGATVDAEGFVWSAQVYAGKLIRFAPDGSTDRVIEMPVKKVTDSGKALRCPMPGLVIAIAVAEGQEVKAGDTLAVVEAMKMENVLRAERDGVVKAIKAKLGDSLAVDAVIMEFG